MRHYLWSRSVLVMALGCLASVGYLPAQAEVKFEAVTSGTLELVPTRLNVLQSTTPATIKVHTDTPIQLRLDPPTFISGPSPEIGGTHKRATLSVNGVRIASDDPSPQVKLPPGTSELTLEMTIEQPTLFQAGSYLYQINLSTIP